MFQNLQGPGARESPSPGLQDDCCSWVEGLPPDPDLEVLDCSCKEEFLPGPGSFFGRLFSGKYPGPGLQDTGARESPSPGSLSAVGMEALLEIPGLQLQGRISPRARKAFLQI
ncbi:predicted protein [Methanosarcina acetivorans C2A]|uniref:Uncharacterized protein n=1 Tax=Methanosarcina acetivorans (strain ATCC 35395 / DSM 2834 / JCM 12185 / C2A) TaxID=188937 RepID=Q8TNQ3_METAC|nr:predicted protein [Methanosarcina acetivorans C2A]